MLLSSQFFPVSEEMRERKEGNVRPLGLVS